MGIVFNNDIISAVPIEKLEPFLNRQTEPFLPLSVKETSRGGDYYRTLCYLSTFFNNSVIFDIGSGHGFSALALSFNESNSVISYDVNRSRGIEIKEKGNIQFNLGDALSDKRLLSAALIYLDTNHDGDFERKVITYLIKNHWQGLLIMDDIFDYPGLKDVWDDLCKKYSKSVLSDDIQAFDITKYGHFSGFGAVVFGNPEITLNFE